jgi:DNA-binding response OmpR family regulator
MRKPTIVLADDDIPLVEALAIRLRARGYAVECVTDGYNALARAVEVQPDLMLLDVHMPASDGITVLERVHAYRSLDGVPVIYITGDGTTRMTQAIRRAGAFGVVLKPIDLTRLLQMIDAALLSPAA